MKSPKPRPGEPIRLVQTTSGAPRYRVVVDAGTNPASGKRRQITTTHGTLTEARAYVSRTRADRERGVLIAPDGTTFHQAAEAWLEERGRRVRLVTLASYASCVKRADASFGTKRLGNVTRQDVERLVAQIAADGRSQRTASLVLFVVRSIFDEAVHDGLVLRNPAARVEAFGRPAVERTTLGGEHLARLRSHLSDDPLYACWLLTLNGLRRSELLGLRWSDIDLSAQPPTLSIVRGRVLTDGKNSVEDRPKTRRGGRILPLPADLAAALRSMRERQARDFGFEHVRTGYIAVNAAGEPMRHESWSDTWRAHCAAASVPVVTLHSARHSSVTAMRDAGVPDHVVAAWHGHDEVIMRQAYSHARPETLARAGEALASVLGRGAGAAP